MINLKNLGKNLWEIPKEGRMKVPCIIFASEQLLEKMKEDKTLEQVRNVAMLPGIVEKSIAMPDAHQGYGFSIGGVAAFDIEEGIISPGGVGYDINCGVRILTTNINEERFAFSRNSVLNEIYKQVPSGVGEKSNIKLDDKELNNALLNGAKWAVSKNFGKAEDLEKIEDRGVISGADALKVSKKAKDRGRNQLGTLGAGNHFLEIQKVETIYDSEIAKRFGINEIGQITIMIHTGSRGLGHQTATDYIQKMEKQYGWADLPDRELICAPVNSQLGKDYFAAMASAANFAFANRQIITEIIRKCFIKFFPKIKIEILYDVAHNIAKFEEFEINGKKQKLCVHRKGATRSFGPGRKEIPKDYIDIGQPVLIPGSMGTFSYVLVGTKKAEEISFGSTAHGAGRILSRSAAIKNLSPQKIKDELEKNDIKIRICDIKGLSEEAPLAYKDVNEVVRVSHDLGIGNLVARLKPLAVIKG